MTVMACAPMRKVAAAVGCLLLAVAGAAFDSIRISRACHLLGSSAVAAAALGAVSVMATAAVFVWAGKRGARARRGLLWWADWLALAMWIVAVMLAFSVTHARDGSDRLTSDLAVGVTTYTGACLFALFFYGGLRMLRPRGHSRTTMADHPIGAGPTGRTHDVSDPNHHAEVWHVAVNHNELDYYIAHCDCDWVGAAYDRVDTEAEHSARREANSHSTNVADLVVEI